MLLERVGLRTAVQAADIVQEVQTGEIDCTSREGQNRLLRLMVFLRIITQRQADLFVQVVQKSGFVLLGTIFFVTPSFMTYRGCVLVGMAFPAYQAIGALTRLDLEIEAASSLNQNGEDAGARKGGESATSAEPLELRGGCDG